MVGGILLAAAVGAPVLFGLTMFAKAYGRTVTEEEVRLDRLPAAFDGFRLLFITDLHRRRLPAGLIGRFKGSVDAVLLGGDLTERGSPLPRLKDNLELLASVAPVYAVHGNHDYYADTEAVDRLLADSGCRLLLDENAALRKGDDTLWLTGVDYPRRGGKTRYDALPPIPQGEESCRIILVHDPIWLSQRVTVPAELVLAGHTHGGQVLLPLIGGKKIESFYTRYRAGWYKWPKGGHLEGDADVFISCGFGTAHLPLRWGSRAELHVVTLRRSVGK